MNADILSLLPKLNDYQLPEKYALDVEHSSPETTESHWQEYIGARDKYLLHKVQHAIVDQVTETFDVTRRTFESPNVPSSDEKKALVERRACVLQTLTEKAAAVQCKILELQAKHSRFQERRGELLNLVLLQQAPGYDNDGDANDEDVTIDERDFELQEEKCAELERKRAALQVSLQTVKRQTTIASMQLEDNKSKWEALVEKENTIPGNPEVNNLANLIHDPVALERLQTANAEKQVELSKLIETKRYFTDMRQLMEKMSGIRVISVDAPPEIEDGLLMTVELLDAYVVNITLRMTVPARNRDFTIAVAKFASDDATLIIGPTMQAEVDEGDTDQVTTVQLRIPPLDDLVKLVASLPTGENLRVLLTEIRARICIVRGRVSEFTGLLQEQGIVAQVGPWSIGSTDSIPSHLEQHVICSWNILQLTIVLRLSPDFPLRNGSVCVDQMIGLGGWDSAVIEGIKENVNRQCSGHRSIVTLLRDVQAEVQRLQDEDGFQLPRTPTMPARRHA